AACNAKRLRTSRSDRPRRRGLRRTARLPRIRRARLRISAPTPTPPAPPPCPCRRSRRHLAAAEAPQRLLPHRHTRQDQVDFGILRQSGTTPSAAPPFTIRHVRLPPLPLNPAPAGRGTGRGGTR